MTKLLAIAKPNEMYRWSQNFAKVHLQARWTGSRVQFYEIWDGEEHALAEEIVKALFPVDVSLKERPFLTKSNETFYAVLYRHRQGNQPIFKKLINNGTKTNTTVASQCRLRRTK